MSHKIALEDRFWAKVDKGGPDECWEWTAGKSSEGYGRISIGNREAGNVFAHRLSWKLHNGNIPAGIYVLHRCDNPSCVNPRHLFLGTPADNMADMVAKERSAAGEKNSQSVLTDQIVLAMRELFDAGDTSTAEAGRRFGISYRAAWKIIRRVSWSHLP